MIEEQKAFPKLDSATPQFWEVRYRENVTPWDFGGIPQRLRQYVEIAMPCRVLIPGCGSAYEARFLAERGWEVTAIDYAPAAVEIAQRNLGPWAHLVKLADFFEFDYGGSPFDAVYERTFLCALKPTLWPAYAERVRELIKPGGALFGFFYYEDKQGGPPFGMKAGELDTILGDGFDRVAVADVTDSIPIFVGKERWEVWRRNA